MAKKLLLRGTLLIKWSGFGGPGAGFLKVPKRFRSRKATAKSQSFKLQSCFIHVSLIWTEVPSYKKFQLYHTSPFLDTDELKMTSWSRKVSGAFEKQVRGRGHCVVFLGNTLYSHSASLHPGVEIGTGEFNVGGGRGVTPRWTCIPSSWGWGVKIFLVA